MDINRNNYEVYMIDYLDGNLSPEKVDELMVFLDKNPDIKEEAEGLDMTLPEAEEQSITFDDKAALKQPNPDKEAINEENYETWFIAFVEGTLTSDEQSRLNEYIHHNPEKQKELKLFKATKLQPEAITFDGKNQLKSIAIIPVAGIDESNYEQKMVARIEGDLSNKEIRTFDEFMKQNPGLEQEFEWFQKTKLQEEKDIVYPYKRKLKKFNIGFAWKTTYNYIATAAAIALLIGFSWNSLFPPEQIDADLANLDRKNIEVKENLETKIKTKPEPAGKTEVKNSAVQTRRETEKKETQPEREDVSQLNMLASKEQSKIDIRDEARIVTDYRVYLPRDYFYKRKYNTERNNVMMAMQDEQGVLSVQDIAWNKLEDWTGVEKTENFDEDKKNIFWTIVDFGIKGVNRVTGSDLKLKREVSKGGELQEYTFQANAFKISRSR